MSSMSDLAAASLSRAPSLEALSRTTAAAIGDPRESTQSRGSLPVTRRMATVIAVNGGPPLTVDLVVDGETIPGASPLLNYFPAVGDIVWLYFSGPDAHVFPPLHYGSIQLAIDRAQAGDNGGLVDLGAGTFAAAGLIVSNTGGLTLRGQGSGKTILRLPDDSNSPILSTEDFDALVGTDDIGGVRKLKIVGVTFDGNKANQTAPADLVRIYGCDIWLEDVVIRNGSARGLVTEWSTDSASPGGDSMESNVWGLRIHDCDSDGMFWNGPHDSQFVNFISYLNGGICADFGPNSYACLVVNGHAWGLGHTVSWRLQASGIQLVQCTGEGASVAAVQMLANDQSVHGFFFDATGGGQGIVFGSPTIAVSGCVVDVHLLNFAAGALNLGPDPAIGRTVGDVGGNRIRASIFQTTGTETDGDPHPDSLLEIFMTGRVGQVSRFRWKGRVEMPGGAQVVGNLAVETPDDFQFKVQTSSTVDERMRIGFEQNGNEVWAILTDTTATGTHDFTIRDSTNNINALRINDAGVVAVTALGVANSVGSAGGGSVVGGFEVFDYTGTSIGFVEIVDSLP